MVNIGSLSTGGRVLAVKVDLAKIVLTQLVCTEIGEKIALSRRVEKHWRYNSLSFFPLFGCLVYLFIYYFVSLFVYSLLSLNTILKF